MLLEAASRRRSLFFSALEKKNLPFTGDSGEPGASVAESTETQFDDEEQNDAAAAAVMKTFYSSSGPELAALWSSSGQADNFSKCECQLIFTVWATASDSKTTAVFSRHFYAE